VNTAGGARAGFRPRQAGVRWLSPAPTVVAGGALHSAPTTADSREMTDQWSVIDETSNDVQRLGRQLLDLEHQLWLVMRDLNNVTKKFTDAALLPSK
jgi:hypothetical protein